MAEEIKRNFDELEVSYSEDMLKAFLTINPTEEEYSQTKEVLLAKLRDVGVTRGINVERLQEMLDKKEYHKPVEVAVGQAPIRGEDGWFEFLFETEIDNKPRILKDGSVDYSQYGNLPSVVEGEEIVKYHPATAAVDGISVKDEIIIAIKGKDLAKLKGKGFFISEDATSYTARHDGKVTYQNERLNVESELVIEGDVSYTTGDVTFLNNIHVRGNVLAGVTIESQKGSIVVDGYVESAILKAKKDIVLKNGMQGNGKGTIKAGGDVTGKFFEQATITCEGDVRANAIMNAMIDAGQDIIVSGKYGIIIGGCVCATRYIQATIIGNMSEVRTEIKGGVEGDLFAMLSRFEKDQKTIEGEHAKIQDALAKIKKLAEFGDNKDLQDKKMILTRAKIEKDTKLREIEVKMQEIVEKMGKANQSKVTIQKVVYPGVVISINGNKVIVSEESRHVEYARRGAGIIVYKIGE